MKIPIIDNIVMSSDSLNIILSRELIVEDGKNKGKKYLKAYAFYPTVVQALEGVLNEKMGESKARTLKTLLHEHQQLLTHFRELLSNDLREKVKK